MSMSSALVRVFPLEKTSKLNLTTIFKKSMFSVVFAEKISYEIL